MKHMLSYNMWIIIKQIITSAHGNHIDSSIQPSNKKQSHVPLNYIPTAGYQTPLSFVFMEIQCLPNNFSSV